MNLQRQIGRQIREERKRKKLNQQSLADRSGIGQKYISSIEKGRVNVTLTTVDKLAAALNKNVEISFTDPDTVKQSENEA